MSKFSVNILGCGSAVPTAMHQPSCQVVDFRDRLLMIDCGEGAQSMMRRMKLKFSRLSDVFVSHMHGDHCFGLPGLLSTMALHEKGGRITLHLPADGVEVMKSYISYFCRDTPYDIVYEPISPKGGVVYEDHALVVEAFPLYHRLPCTGFIFREKPKLPHLRGDVLDFYKVPLSERGAIREGADFVTEDGVLVPNSRFVLPPEPSVSYAYCSDTMMDERVAKAVEGVDVLYHEATYSDEMAVQAREYGHSTAAQAGRIARMAGVKKLVIGHYSKRITDVQVLVEQAKREFDVVIPANEGLKIDLL